VFTQIKLGGNMRGYYGIGIVNGKDIKNVGTLWRSAYILGAKFIFTIGVRYKHQCSDTTKAHKHIPYYHYDTFEEFYKHMPKDCKLVGIELDDYSVPIKSYEHFERCIYLLGAEDNGLPKDVLIKCHDIVQLPGDVCLNVSVAGSIVLYDRLNKQK
jgi:tRNA G18 (ribose-2'-O)-methylase SpoU